MNQDRLKQLSGLHPNHQLITSLKEERTKMIEAYDALIQYAEKNQQLDEGIFTTLKATLATIGQLGAAGASKAVESAKKLGADVKEVYLDAKAKAELQSLIKNTKNIIVDFEDLEKGASTILKRDAEVRTEMELFMKLFRKFLASLEARIAVSKESK